MSDFQYLQHILDNLMWASVYPFVRLQLTILRLFRIEENNEDDGHKLGPREIYEYLSQVMYARRSKINPLWNSMIVGGFKDGARFVSPSFCFSPAFSSPITHFIPGEY